MTRVTLLKAIAWFNFRGAKMNEKTLFEVAFYTKYGYAHPRCHWCFDLYLHHGTIPAFVVEFLTFVLIVRRSQ